MNSHVCQYSVIRFLPYRETDEFVNVGILLLCEDTGFLGYRLERRRSARIAGFFQEMDRNVFMLGVQAMNSELRRVTGGKDHDEDGHVVLPGTSSDLAATFVQLVRPRRTLFYFSEPRVIMSDHPADTLNQLFQTYVHRQFAQTHEYKEQLMREAIHRHLQQWHLSRLYRAHSLGTDVYKMNFPFVHLTLDGIPARAIRALHLDRRDTTEIFRRGDEITAGLKRLRDSDALPENCMVVVKQPRGTGSKADVAHQVCTEVEKLGITVTPYRDTQHLRTFAAEAKTEDGDTQSAEPSLLD
jgi:hypothetical protein